jgi:hypothetical protein
MHGASWLAENMIGSAVIAVVCARSRSYEDAD